MEKKHSLLLSFILGGLTGSLFALVFAPNFMKTRNAAIRGVETIGNVLRNRIGGDAHEGVYCAEEGSSCSAVLDTCRYYDEQTDIDKIGE